MHTPPPLPHHARARRAMASHAMRGYVGTVMERGLTFGCEQKLAVQAAVLLDVLHTDRGEALADGASGLIRSQNSLARGADRVLWRQGAKAGSTVLTLPQSARSCTCASTRTAVAINSAANGVTDFDSSAMVAWGGGKVGNVFEPGHKRSEV